MIAQERLPALGRGSSPARHMLGDAGLADIDAELEQFVIRMAELARLRTTARVMSSTPIASGCVTNYSEGA